MPQQFLVIQTAFIGDVVLATGIIEKLHTYFPDAAIDFLVRKGNEGLLKGHPFIRETLVWNKKEGKMRNLKKMLRIIQAKKYDKVINVQRYAATGILTAFSGAKEKIGYDKNPLSFLFTTKVKHIFSDAQHPIHEIDRCNDLIKHFTDDKVFKPKLYPTTEDENAVAQYKQGEYICVAPASVWFTKQFPSVKWISFLQKVPKNIQVYLLGAPSDKGLCEEIINGCPSTKITDLSGKLSFLQSAALMKNSIMNYVNDSAPMHFASSVNAPVAAVYCSTVPYFGFGPLSDKKIVIEVEEKLSCRPCGIHGYKACPLKHFKCAMDIRDEQLLRELRMES